MEFFDLVWIMDINNAATGTDSAPDNPLARATNCLLKDGKPFTRLSKCFFLDQSNIMRWLGIFIHSAGERIIFYPGYSEPQSHITAFNDNTQRWDQPFIFDHLTLEPDWKSWHITEPNSENHLGKIYTRSIGEEIYHWFSMSVSSSDDLRLARKETRVLGTSPFPPKEIERRLKIFGESRDSAEFPIISLNNNQSYCQPSFLHFSVVIGPPGFSLPSTDVLGLPYGSPLSIERPEKLPKDIPCRVHRCKLSDSAELLITASVLPGKIKNKFIYTGMPTSNGAQV